MTSDIPHNPWSCKLVDVGGQRNERRKWVHAFRNVDAVAWVVNLADYHNVLYEDPKCNRMVDALSLFSKTVNNEIPSDMPVYLFFNKSDLFEGILKDYPITFCESFKDYQGDPQDMQQALDYVAEVFKKEMPDSKKFRHFVVSANTKDRTMSCWSECLHDLHQVKSAS